MNVASLITFLRTVVKKLSHEEDLPRISNAMENNYKGSKNQNKKVKDKGPTEGSNTDEGNRLIEKKRRREAGEKSDNKRVGELVIQEDKEDERLGNGKTITGVNEVRNNPGWHGM